MGSAAASLALHYEQRRPESTVLYRLVAEHLETFLAAARESYGKGPAPVRRARAARLLDLWDSRLRFPGSALRRVWQATAGRLFVQTAGSLPVLQRSAHVRYRRAPNRLCAARRAASPVGAQRAGQPRHRQPAWLPPPRVARRRLTAVASTGPPCFSVPMTSTRCLAPCGGRLHVIALITEPDVAAAILTALHLPVYAGICLAQARAPRWLAEPRGGSLGPRAVGCHQPSRRRRRR